jgi:aryl-alcohol dehydrogenase-like predicted oxidoreductase/histidinol phosphatase-like enzyme/predicted kinase
MRRTSDGSPLIGMGCMRLSTERSRDDDRSIAVLHAALDAGVNFLDTADAYCWDSSEIGHNERLISRSLATWQGDRSRILVATKGGLIRPFGAWVEDGRARHLAAACEASRRALGVDRISLYQLHAPDPRTPLATSVRALASLKRDGLIEKIGLCNVNVGEIEEARAITEIASVQIELSIWRHAAILSGVAEYCLLHGIQLLAHRPLGGKTFRRRTLSDPVLSEIAARHDATPFEIAIAWLADLSDLILPLPGASRVETAQSIGRAGRIQLTEDDRVRLDERVAAGRTLRFPGAPRQPPATHPSHGDVVVIMGVPGAGKSCLAQTFVARGYTRLNRDEKGGSLAGLLPALDDVGESPLIVLDNTYASRQSRAAVVQAAWQKGLAVRCIWLNTSVEDAQVNAVERMLANHGKLLAGDEIRKARKHDPTVFAPTVQFRYQRELEPPDAAEGFASVEVLPFERRRDSSFINRAVIVWCDGVLTRSRSGRRAPANADDVEVVAGRGEVLQRYRADGWQVLGLSWQPEIADETSTSADVEAGFIRMRELLGLEIEVEYCPHAAGPPSCWCRKPLPGLGVVLIRRHRLDPGRCIYIGAGAQDPGFARRLGFAYQTAEQFFGS